MNISDAAIHTGDIVTACDVFNGSYIGILIDSFTLICDKAIVKILSIIEYPKQMAEFNTPFEVKPFRYNEIHNFILENIELYDGLEYFDESSYMKSLHDALNRAITNTSDEYQLKILNRHLHLMKWKG